MVLPIGFFAPLPLAIMIPFMAAQSFAMGQAFGTSFQYGKRKISSMSNEEFNALTAVEIADNLQSDVRAMIPSMTESFHRMEDFQIDILESMVRTMILAVEKFFQFIGTGANAINPYVGTGSTTALDDFSGADIPGFIPTASATDSGTTKQKFASDYEAEAMRLPFKLLADIVQKILSGKMPNLSIEKRTGYVNAYKKRIPPKSTTTPTQAITASGATGIVKQIATMYANLVKEFKVLAAMSNTTANKNNIIAEQRRILILLKAYNRFVQLNRRANLTIDTAKSLTFRRIIPKT